MLKKNLVRTSFLSHGLLIFVPSVATISSLQLGTQEVRYTASHEKRSWLDTMIVSTDSAGQTITRHLTEEEKAAAPKVSLNRQAMKFTKDFMKREKEALDKVSLRAEPYFMMIDTIFEKYGLPQELKYLAVVESDLKTSALSRVGARGMWQLMPVTARELGLHITKKYDERTHAYKSTVAAAKYLRSLHKEFGDWLLALAAYNGGPGTVYKAIRMSGSKNFWALQQYLPAESRGHVKRFIGTHYYFEGQGGITTQTKTEALAYKKKLNDYVVSLSSVDSVRVAVK